MMEHLGDGVGARLGHARIRADGNDLYACRLERLAQVARRRMDRWSVVINSPSAHRSSNTLATMGDRDVEDLPRTVAGRHPESTGTRVSHNISLTVTVEQERADR